MGGGGKGGSTTVSKVEIPPEVLARYNAVNARAESVAQQPYQPYSYDPNAFVAPLTATQQAGIQNTNIMAGAAQPYYGAATEQLLQAQQGAQPYMQGATAATLAGGQSVNPNRLQIGRYMNPFTQGVVNATQAALNQQQGQQLAQQQADAIRAGAFGGQRAGLQRAQLMGQQGLAQAQAIAPLYQQNYNQALAAAQQQQGVNLAAQQANRAALQQTGQGLATLGQQGYNMGAGTSTALANLGTGAQQAGLAGAQAQLAAGQTQQQTQQAGLQALYNQFQQQQGYPFQVAQFLANIAEGTGALSGNQSTSSTTGGGGFFSDKRLKENIQKIGETNDGQPIYRYNYKGDDRTQIGLLAQNVEKDHPEAVGLAGGYKTVDYKKATDDAVHKADGGDVTDAYSMTSPSGMLEDRQGLGALALPRMVTGADIPIQASAVNPATAGLLAPKATGYSPGTLEGKRAELSSLRSSMGQGLNGLGSGPGYVNDRIGELEKFLATNSSQGGLVGPQGGEFSRGGYADGGYMNPALQYYAPVGGQGGLYGVQLQPSQQRQMLQPAQAPQRQQRNAIEEATNIAKLVGSGNEAWKARPDFLRSAEDVAAREKVAEAARAKEAMIINQAKERGLDFARGGYAGKGYVDAGSGPYSTDSYLSDVLQTQAKAPQPQMLKGGEMPRPPKQQSGIGEITQAINLGKQGKSAYDWAAKQLAGEASPTAMSSTTAEAAPGVAGASTAPVAPAAEAATGVAGAAPEALSAGVAGAAEAAAPELAAGLAGGAEAVAPVAAAGESIMDFLPFFFLKDGGAVPHRRHYQTAGLVVPDAANDGEEPSPRGDRLTVVPKTIVEPAFKPGPMITEAPAAKKEAPSLLSMDGLGAAAKEAAGSEKFWVPAIAGVGAMLASPNKTLASAIGSGLVGGTTAYTNLQKQLAERAKTEAETRGLETTTYQKSISSLPDGTNIAWLANGNIMLLGDYDRLAKAGNAPPLLGRIPENANERISRFIEERKAAEQPKIEPRAKPATQAAPGTTEGAVKAKPAAEAAPAQAKEPQKKIQPSYDDASRATAEAERNVSISGGPAAKTAADLTQKYINAVAPTATAARDSQRYLGELTENLAEATKGKGLDVPGFGFSGRAQITSALNTLSRAFGGSGDFGQSDTIEQINNKIKALQSSITAAGGNQESYAALKLLSDAVAAPSMSPRAYSKLSADLLAQNQRAIDRDIHMSKYRNDSNGSLANAAQDFERLHDPSMYEREAAAIQKMILKAPDLIKDFRSGKYTAQQIDSVFAKQGLRNMSRYFVGAQ